MSDSDNRNISRDSLFILAELRIDGRGDEHRVKVRNLSAGGMMAEGPARVARGERVEVNLRNVGWVEGSVAWVQENRFGIAFAEDLDPSVIRVPVAASADQTPRQLKNIYASAPAPGPARKIF
ncbi:MAG TPA: PilZ domain-containing protein [Novosphingobium sp.]|nr:PilZ domain-containing protein [Novosphingobium sp.]